MLGRTRPASRILLWPHSKTRAVRFTSSTSSRSSHETTAEYEPEDTTDDAVSSSPTRRTFKHIRKLISGLYDTEGLRDDKCVVRRVTSNTAPAIPPGSQAKVEKGLSEDEHSDDAAERKWAPVRRVAAEDDPNWTHKCSLQPERASNTGSRQSSFPGNWGRAANNGVDMAPSGQWKSYSPNPDLVERKPPTSAHLPRPTPPSIFPPQKKKHEIVEVEDGAPPRSKILDEMRTLNFETPPSTEAEQPRARSEPPGEEEMDNVQQDDGPPRSIIIEEMSAWNYVPPGTEAGADVGEEREAVVRQTPPRAQEETTEELPPLDGDFREWLETAIDTSIREAELNKALTSGVPTYDGPTVLVLNAASRSLVESDFYRLAPQGKHLGDWAVGIARVIQARHPSTYEPLGKYYIFFHTRAAALAYEEEVWRLHFLSRRAAQLVSSSQSSSDLSIPGSLPLTPTLAAESADLDAALKGFTLLPHSAMLDLKLHLCKDLPLPATDKLSDMTRYLSSSPETDPAQEQCSVLVSLEGCKATISALHDAIARDGEERRIPWGLTSRSDGKPPIAAIVPGNTRERGRHDARFWRFIVSFAEAAEARRFVRNWHRREMRDFEGMSTVVTFNATVLW